MEDVVVVGAGLAGLACACDLADAGLRPLVLERRPFAGGKTYSFTDRETGATVDNGQHVYLGCCTEYMAFLHRLGTYDLAPLQPRFRLRVTEPGHGSAVLRDAGLPAPLHLLPSLLAYRHVSLLERLRTFPALLAMRRIGERGRARFEDETFESWLKRHGQGQRAIDRLWDLFVVPALNAPSSKVSAAAALQVFQDALLASPKDAAVGIPGVGLTRLHVEPAVEYVESRRGRVRCGAAVRAVERCADGFTLVVDDGERLDVSRVVLALPPTVVLGMLPGPAAADPFFDACQGFEMAPIVDLHFWYDRRVMEEQFEAFLGSPVQWVFNKTDLLSAAEAGAAEGLPPGGQYLTVSLSAAWEHVGATKAELLERFRPEMERLFPKAQGATIERFVMVKEPEATFVPKPGVGRMRPGQTTPVSGLYLAGAWTQTGWPATMESAVRSGRLAARELLSRTSAHGTLTGAGSGV